METRYGTLAAVAVAAAFFWPGPSAFAGGAKEAKPSGPATVTVWDFKYGDPRTGAVMKKIDEAFMAANPDIVIKHVAQPEDNYYQMLGTAAAARRGPDVGLFHVGAKHQDFDDYLVDLGKFSAAAKGKFTPAAIAKSTDKSGKKWEMYPMTMQGMGIYYNKALFRKAGLDPNTPPKSGAEFIAACEKLKAAGIVPITTGQSFTVDFLFRCFAANVFADKTDRIGTADVSFKDPGFVAAASFVKTLVDRGFAEPAGKDRPYFMEAIDAFAAGKGAFFVGLLSDVAHWKSFGDAIGKNDVGYFPTINLPEIKNKDIQASQSAGIGYGIFTWSTAQAAAAAYLEFVSAGPGAEIFSAELGALSPNVSLDTGKLGYSALTDINKYLAKTAPDYLNLTGFEGGLENMVQRLQDQAFLLGTLTPQAYADMMDKTVAEMRVK
jgi:ABC-type glycerol-3-phosphate transport system substrate-binding protein